jgi:hypothetical protein
MRYISRPLPATCPTTSSSGLDLAMAANPDPAYLVETRPPLCAR